MKKVYLHAYCQQNLGDDMFILRMVRRYPKVRFYAMAKPEYRQALAMMQQRGGGKNLGQKQYPNQKMRPNAAPRKNAGDGQQRHNSQR